MTSDDLAGTAKDIASRTKAAAENVADTARSSLGDTAAAAADRASDMAGKVGDKAADVYQRARDGAADLGQRMPSAGEAVDAGRRAYSESSERVARQVGKQPIEALLLAGAIGYLVGWAANRS